MEENNIGFLVLSFLLLNQSSAIVTNVGTWRATSLQSWFLNLGSILFHHHFLCSVRGFYYVNAIQWLHRDRAGRRCGTRPRTRCGRLACRDRPLQPKQWRSVCSVYLLSMQSMVRQSSLMRTTSMLEGLLFRLQSEFLASTGNLTSKYTLSKVVPCHVSGCSGLTQCKKLYASIDYDSADFA